MAVTNAGQTSLTFTNLPIGVQVTKITDTSADWASVANSTYFYDKGDGLVHYKNSSGIVLELFSAGGLTYFTEAQSTASPNVVVPVESLTATAAATNADVAIVPKGTGAFMLAVPNNGLGGDKRGQYAVDLQLNNRTVSSRVASGNSSITIGRDNTASGTDSLCLGALGNATNTQSMIIGSGTSSGAASIAFGTSVVASNTVSASIGNLCTASGTNSMALGHSSGATGDFSYALGREHTVSGVVASAIGGQACISSGSRSIVIGHSSIANGDYSFALGYQSNSFSVYGRQTYASGRFLTTGDAQKSLLVLRIATPSDTPTILTSDAGVAAATNQLFINTYSTIRFKGTIVGRAQSGGPTDVGVWDIDGVMSRATATPQLTVGNVNLVTNPAPFGTPTLTIDTVNRTLRVQVTGLAGVPAQWVATIETTEVIYV